MGMQEGSDTIKSILNKYDRTIKRNIKKPETQKDISQMIIPILLVMSLFIHYSIIVLYIIGNICTSSERKNWHEKKSLSQHIGDPLDSFFKGWFG